MSVRNSLGVGGRPPNEKNNIRQVKREKNKICKDCSNVELLSWPTPEGNTVLYSVTGIRYTNTVYVHK